MIKINATGRSGSDAVTRMRQAMADLRRPQRIELLVDDEAAVAAVTAEADKLNLQSASEKKPHGHYAVTLDIESVPDRGPIEEPESHAPDKNRNIVVQFCSQSMGEDTSELGRAMLKSFIFALAKQEPLPNTLLFYDAGAALTCEGSSVLEDLKAMEEEGVRILTCKPSLSYNNLMDKLCVGQEVDMYTMARIMIDADHIMKP